jgi:lipopolysaccharide export LptBFGC system permease protein LptF
MLAVLATYVIKSRQNEIVTWIGAGLSVYRLLLPSFAAAAFLGLVNWGIQELVLPVTNPVQDDLRTQIRSMGTVKRENGRYWAYDDGKIMTFITSASDNVPQLLSPTIIQIPSIEPNLQLTDHLRTVAYRSPSAQWTNGTLILKGSVERLEIGGGSVSRSTMGNTEVTFAKDPMFGISEKPSHLTRKELRSRMDDSESDTEKRMYAVALMKRYATPFLPLVIALVAAPFGLSLARRGRVLAVGGAIGMWLLFVGATSLFEQFGQNGVRSVSLAVWAPLAIFAALGIYLLSSLRT